MKLFRNSLWTSSCVVLVTLTCILSSSESASTPLQDMMMTRPSPLTAADKGPATGNPGASSASETIDSKRRLTEFARLLCPLNKQGCGLRKNEPSTIPLENSLSYASIERDLPWQVSIRVTVPQSSAKWFCSGVIIREEWILTHAFCLYHETPGDLSSKSIVVLPGTSSPFSNDSITVRASKYFIHPHFDSFPSEFDIALIKLKRRLNVSASGPLRMICLPESEELDTGLGRISGWPHFNINHLVWTTAVSSSIKDCISEDIKNKTSLMCVSSKSPPDCGMDLGSPFTRSRASDGAQVLIGIKSQDGKCRKSLTSPSVSRYIRVSQFLGWIADKLNACSRRSIMPVVKTGQKVVSTAPLGLSSLDSLLDNKN